MVSGMQKLAFSNNTSIDHRRLAVEVAEIIIKWELQRIKDEAEEPEVYIHFFIFMKINILFHNSYLQLFIGPFIEPCNKYCN